MPVYSELTPPTSPTFSDFTFTDSMHTRPFREDSGRLYNAIQDDYGFPADNREVLRLNNQHVAIRTRVSRNYHGPVEEQLRREDGDEKRVLDLGCGTGIWCIEMAHEFPNVQFTGVDLVPIQPDEFLPDNVHFIIDDIVNGLSFPDESFDIVHHRFLIGGIRDYPAMLESVARVLKPGGMILSVEPDLTFSSHEQDMEKFCPGVTEFGQAISHAFRTRGLDPQGAWNFPKMIKANPHFPAVNVTRVDIPLSPWSHDVRIRNAGQIMLRASLGFAETSRVLIMEASGMKSNDFDKLAAKLYVDLTNPCARPLWWFGMAWARKADTIPPLSLS